MSFSAILDIVLGIVCVFTIVKYTAKGILKSVLDVARLALSVLFAFMFRKVVAKMINSLFMSKAIYNWVYRSVYSSAIGQEAKIDFIGMFEKNPGFYSKILANFDLNFEQLEKNMENFNEGTAAEVTKLISEPLATMLSTLIAVVVIFIISMIALTIVVKLLNKLASIKGVNLVNKLLGCFLGIVISVIIIWLVSFVMELLVGALGPILPNIFNQELIEKSLIINFVRQVGLLGILDGIKARYIGFII